MGWLKLFFNADSSQSTEDAVENDMCGTKSREELAPRLPRFQNSHRQFDLKGRNDHTSIDHLRHL